jgi:hypothetical protein
LGRRLSASASVTAWHGWAALGLILMLLATLIVAIQLLSGAELPRLRVSWNVVVLALDVVGAAIFAIRSLRLPSSSVPGFSVGLRWGGWILLIAVVAQVVYAALRFRASGESLARWDAMGSPPPPPPPM